MAEICHLISFSSLVMTKKSSGKGCALWADAIGVTISKLLIFQSFLYLPFRITRTRAFCRPIQLLIVKLLTFIGFSTPARVKINAITVSASTQSFSNPLSLRSSSSCTKTIYLQMCKNLILFANDLSLFKRSLLYSTSIHAKYANLILALTMFANNNVNRYFITWIFL